MYSITAYGDFPIMLPASGAIKAKSASSGWMLLSYKSQ
jgi:hypothetical protein